MQISYFLYRRFAFSAFTYSLRSERCANIHIQIQGSCTYGPNSCAQPSKAVLQDRDNYHILYTSYLLCGVRLHFAAQDKARLSLLLQ
jgi:hypothetical protein